MIELQVSHYEENNLYIVTIGNDLTIETVGTFNQYVKPLIETVLLSKDMRGVVLDMKKVSMLDSSGIGAICGKLIKLKKTGKKLALCNINKTIKDTFVVSGLGSTLTYYSSIPEALAILGTDETPDRKEPEHVVKKPILPKNPPKEKGLENFMDKKARERN